MIDWLEQNFWELFGTFSALIYLFFSIRQKIWLWPWGIITSAVFVYVFFTSKFYADMGLNVYYVIISIYGWYHWNKGEEKSKADLPVRLTPQREWWIIAVASLIIYAFIYYVLKNYTDSPVPFGDSFTTALSIVATWMLARKYLEQWILWVVVDLVSLGLYLYKDLWITAGLFFVYSVLAVYGYLSWKKSMNPVSAENKERD